MVLKNSKYTFLLMGLVYGVAMGLVYGLQGNMTAGLIAGGFCGVMFGGAIYVFNNRLEKKAQTLFQQVGSMRIVICQGSANYRKSPINAIGGWMFLTEAALEFYPHKANLGGRNVPVMLRDIVSTSVTGNVLTVKTPTQSYGFNVIKAKIWKEQIDRAVQSIKGAQMPV